MNLKESLVKINRYFASDNFQPLLVNVNNRDDLNSIINYYDVDTYEVFRMKDFCKTDELPSIENVLGKISTAKKKSIFLGLTSFLKFFGDKEVKKHLINVVNMSNSNHIVIITFQCERLLDFNDPRLSRNICLIDGVNQPIPKLTFCKKEVYIPENSYCVNNIENSIESIEMSKSNHIYVITNKIKNDYLNASYMIDEINNAFNVIRNKESIFNMIDESLGSIEQWEYLLDDLQSVLNLSELCNQKFGNYKNLEIIIPSYNNFSEYDKWLYFIALKLFGTNNVCLKSALNNSVYHSQLIKRIYRNILSINPNDDNFMEFYSKRKVLLNAFGNPIDEVVDFCKFVQKEKELSIYYLTDNTRQEKELIIDSIEKYYQDVNKKELENILKIVYPGLFQYMCDYRFKLPLLNSYFSKYTHSKVINKVLPELKEMVLEQAISREYNLLIEPRTVLIDSIDKNNSQLYFMDAMGVEYLSYIMAKCKEKSLMANIHICCANLPSITSKNKEFIDEFESRGLIINSIKDLDEIKHHGVNDYDYRQRKQPIHIIRELEIIDETLNHIQLKLLQGLCEKVIMISDHGASRMAVINETENMWEMSSKGEHSGRCCPISDADVKTEFATEEDGFWVLANYDRFKGGRKANFEVHGGATLEEIVVPIIEITKLIDKIEVILINNVITVSYRKKAAVQLFSMTKLKNLSVCVEGCYYDAKEFGDNTYLVEMPNLKKAKKYYMDVYSSNNLIVSGLTFEIIKEGSQEKDLL